MFLAEFVNQSALAGAGLQSSAGSMPAGCNGPYNHPETPLRNTAHWIPIWRRAYADNQNEACREAAKKALGYLLKQESHRPANCNFVFRNQENYDRCNGVIGAAWLIEGLMSAYEWLEDTRALDLCKALHALHPWNARAALWSKIEADGTATGFDRTFNHQLWFAAAAGLMAPHCDTARAQALAFLKAMPTILRLTPEGRVVHHINPKLKSLDKASHSGRNVLKKKNPGTRNSTTCWASTPSSVL